MADIELNWPLDIRPAQQAFFIETRSVRWPNPYTGQVQVLERDAARWKSRIELRRPDKDARQLDALIAALRGSVGHVFVPHFARLKASGSMAGDPQLVSGTGTTLTIEGFTPNALGVLLAGDYIQTAPGRIHMVLQDVDADGTGAALVAVAPRLREAVVAGPLVTENCRVRMRLASDESNENLTDIRFRTSFLLDLMEVLPQ
ncbi:MAG: hypothetical protein H6861_08270 [Rhodospirillales bacterium]|nr:hypothetical protein [Rhodospirillales bacterium]